MFSLPSPQKINKRIQSRNIGVIDLASEKYFDKKFAVSVRDMNLRVKPTEMPKYSPEGFDMNCETLCRRGEIMILLSEKPKNGFYLVHSVNTQGYAAEQDIAWISRGKAIELINSDSFVCITDKFVLTSPSRDENISKIPLSFGTKLPLIAENSAAYSVLLPFRGDDGKVKTKTAEIPKSCTVSKGYLKFTRKNILQLSLRMRGMPYDWGESFGGCDCSSLICAAFSLCGVFLPRNSSKIAKISCKEVPFKKGKTAFLRCRPADIIVCKGHVMLYYGKCKGKNYVFHSFLGSRGITDITTADEKTSAGVPFTDIAEKIISLRYI